MIKEYRLNSHRNRKMIPIFSSSNNHYSYVPNKRACTFISGKVCLLTLIEPKRQTLPEINMHACLFGTLKYLHKMVYFCFTFPSRQGMTLGKLAEDPSKISILLPFRCHYPLITYLRGEYLFEFFIFHF